MLTWITLVYEHGARLPLAAVEDVIVPLGTDAVPLRELPHRAGVWRPGIDMGITRLTELGCLEVEPIPTASRGKQARLTPRGREALSAGPARLARVHGQLAQRFGAGAIDALTELLDPIVGDATREHSPLYAGLQPPAGTWRDRVTPLPRLPRFPLVLHRGGYPDGA